MSLSKKYKGVNLLELSEDELEALIFADFSENEENISSSDESFVGAVYSDDEIEDDVLDLPTGPSTKQYNGIKFRPQNQAKGPQKLDKRMGTCYNVKLSYPGCKHQLLYHS